MGAEQPHEKDSPGGSQRTVIALLIALVFASDPLQVQTDALITQAYQRNLLACLAPLRPPGAQRRPNPPGKLPVESRKPLPRLVMLYALLVLLLNLVILRALFPRHAAWLWQSRIKPFLKQVLSSLPARNCGLPPSSGFAAPFASWVRLQAAGSRLLPACLLAQSHPPLIAYFAIALLVTYLPGRAMGQPACNFTSSLGKAADFPWEGKVLFAGTEYLINELPQRFLPTLMALQFTETALVASWQESLWRSTGRSGAPSSGRR